MKVTTMAAMAVLIGMSARASEVSTLEAIEDPEVVAAMETAWQQTGNGRTGIEATFRLDGSPADYHVVAAPLTNQFMKQRVDIIPGTTFAVFHVHPNGSDPEPSKNDVRVADKYGFRIYTMHAHGLYEYDPVTGKTTKLRDGLRWLKPVANREIARNMSQ